MSKFQDLYDELKIKLNFVSLEHPQTNVQVESTNNAPFASYNRYLMRHKKNGMKI